MSSILVVDGNGDISSLIDTYFGQKGYQVTRFENGDDAVRFALKEMPVLAVMDIMTPGFDGYQMIQRLRDHPKCMHIPIIVLSAYSSLVDRVRAYELGVDVYINEPFEPNELFAHMRRQLCRLNQNTLSPLTHLPGGLQLERAIDYKFSHTQPWSILYLDLDNFKAFNDTYGFVAGNDMILLVGRICQQVVYTYGNADDFVGHVGGDDFVIVTTPDCENALCEYILERYKEGSRNFFKQEDIERGWMSGTARNGLPDRFPLVSLSIGIVNDQLCCSQTVDEVGTLTAEAKRLAKKSSNSVSHISANWNISTHFPLSYTSSTYQMLRDFDLFPFSQHDAVVEF